MIKYLSIEELSSFWYQNCNHMCKVQWRPDQVEKSMIRNDWKVKHYQNLEAHRHIFEVNWDKKT